MRDHPSALDLAAAESCPPAHIDLDTVGLYSDDPINAVTKGKVVTGLNLEVTDLKAERPFE